jgi:hypothetical protein
MRGHRPVETDFQLIDLSALSADTTAYPWLKPQPTPQSIVSDHRAVWRMRHLQSRAAWNRCLPTSHGRARCPATSAGGRPGSFMPSASPAGRLPVSVVHLYKHFSQAAAGLVGAACGAAGSRADDRGGPGACCMRRARRAALVRLLQPFGSACPQAYRLRKPKRRATLGN